MLDDEPDEAAENLEENDLEQAADDILEAGSDIIPDGFPFSACAEDVARKIYDYPTIARRYGLSEDGFISLCRIDAFKKMVQEKRALWNSDAAAPDRLRAMAQENLIQAMPMVGAMITDPNTPKGTLVDMIKVTSKIAGVDGPAQRSNPGGTDLTPTAAQFIVNINMSGRKVETINAQVIQEPPALELAEEDAA